MQLPAPVAPIISMVDPVAGAGGGLALLAISCAGVPAVYLHFAIRNYPLVIAAVTATFAVLLVVLWILVGWYMGDLASGSPEAAWHLLRSGAVMALVLSTLAGIPRLLFDAVRFALGAGTRCGNRLSAKLSDGEPPKGKPPSGD